MIVEEKSVSIQKIRKGKNRWLLYPKGEDKPLQLDADKVYGKLPPVWKFPWQSHDLKLKIVAKHFVAYAEMDGVVLFDVPEDEYPEQTKAEIRRIQSQEKQLAAAQEEYEEALKQQLIGYLPQVPEVKELEDVIAELPVCWRLYLVMLLPLQYQNDDVRRRLELLYHLILIANRIYKRHVDTQSRLDVALGSLRFMAHNSVFPNLSEEMAEMLETKEEYFASKAFTLYREVRAELLRVLPSMPKRLEVYLNHVVCQLLELYAEDLATLDRCRCRHLLGTPTATDKDAYSSLRREMKLPKFKSLLVEKQFTAEEIEDFDRNF